MPKQHKPHGTRIVFHTDELISDPRLQARPGGTDPEHVLDLRRVVKDRKQKELPRVQVIKIKDPACPPDVTDGGMYIWDGHHTHRSYSDEGRPTIPINYVVGTWVEALLLAAGANKQHLGKKRDRATVRRAIAIALAADPKMSNLSVAALVGCDRDTVADVRKNGESLPVRNSAPKPVSNGLVFIDERPEPGPVDVSNGTTEFTNHTDEYVPQYTTPLNAHAAEDEEPLPPRPRQPKPVPMPAPGQVVFDWKRADDAIGTLARLLDDVGHKFPDEKGSMDMHGARRSLESFLANWKLIYRRNAK